MILHRYVEQAMTMCRSITHIPFEMILHRYVEQVMMLCRKQEWQLLLSYFLSYFPLMVLGMISCPLYNLNTFWNFFMILHRYVEQVMTMCREQEWQLLLSYFLSYFPLMILGVRSIAWIPFEIFSWYFTDMKNRSWRFVSYMNDNSCIHTLWVISLWYFELLFESLLHICITLACSTILITLYLLEYWWTCCDILSVFLTLSDPSTFPPPHPTPPKKKKNFFLQIWILCPNSLTRELKIRFVGLVV